MTIINPLVDKYAMIYELIKSCSNCKHSQNVQCYADVTTWYCGMTPSSSISMEGDFKEEFESFYCSKWLSVFDGIKKDSK